MNGKRDYEYIRYEYEVVKRSTAELAKKYELSESALIRRIKKEGWERSGSEKCMERLIRISNKLECSIEDALSEPLDIKSCKELTAAIKDAVAIRRNLFRLPTQAEEFEQKISFEKLNKAREEDSTVSVEFAEDDYCT